MEKIPNLEITWSAHFSDIWRARKLLFFSLVVLNSSANSQTDKLVDAPNHQETTSNFFKKTEKQQVMLKSVFSRNWCCYIVLGTLAWYYGAQNRNVWPTGIVEQQYNVFGVLGVIVTDRLGPDRHEFLRFYTFWMHFLVTNFQSYENLNCS